MKHLKVLLMAGSLVLVSAGAGAMLLYDEGGSGGVVPPAEGTQAEESVMQPPVDGVNVEPSDQVTLPDEVSQIEPEPTIPETKLQEKVDEITQKIKEFYGVEDLAELGRLGEHLKQMLDEIVKSGMVDNLELKEVYKDGKYVLELNWTESFAANPLCPVETNCLPIREVVYHKLTFEGKIDKDGNISPSKITWEKVYDDGKVGATFPRETHTFTFDSHGIASETIEYTESRPIFPPPIMKNIKNKS
jgi:hypothetical protein